SIADRDYQHFIQAVANVLGGAILRHRTRRRIELELDVGRVLAGAADIGSMHEGLGAAFERTLSSAWVELWARDAAAAEGWSRSCPAGGGEPLAPPWAGALLPPSRSDVVVANGERGVE